MDNSFGVLEAEIAELQKKIEEKKNILESQGGIIEEKVLVSEAVEELFVRPVISSNQSSINDSSANSGGNGSYLENLDSQTTESITTLIERIPQVGIAKVVAEASLGNPYLIDVLHDALVDRLYEELLARGIVSSK